MITEALQWFIEMTLLILPPLPQMDREFTQRRVKLEIWGKAQRKSARRPKSD